MKAHGAGTAADRVTQNEAVVDYAAAMGAARKATTSGEEGAKQVESDYAREARLQFERARKPVQVKSEAAGNRKESPKAPVSPSTQSPSELIRLAFQQKQARGAGGGEDFEALVNMTVRRELHVTGDGLHKLYKKCCAQLHVKPNSKALERFNSAVHFKGADGKPQSYYDFANANLGDRGVVCVLYALAKDLSCAVLSLQSCGLRGGSLSAIATFLELHPRLMHLNLSKNNFSYDAGEALLTVLKRVNHRHGAEGGSVVLGGTSNAGTQAPLVQRKVTLDLAGTGLAWGRGGPTVGPPEGLLWADAGSHGSRFAPSSYEHLRARLDHTHHVWWGEDTSRAHDSEASQTEDGTPRKLSRWSRPSQRRASLTAR